MSVRLRNCFYHQISFVCLSACLAQKAGRGKGEAAKGSHMVNCLMEHKGSISQPKDDSDLTAYRRHVMSFK